MAGAWRYGWTSLKKRQELKYLLLGQLIILITTYYTITLANILSSSLIRLGTTVTFNLSLINIFGSFVTIIAVVSFLSSIWFYFITLRILMFYQARDLATMIGVGGLVGNIRTFMVTPIMLIMILANSGAWLIANIFLYGSILVINSISHNITFPFVYNFPDLMSIVLWVIFLMISYIGASIAVVSATNKKQDIIIYEQIEPVEKISKGANLFVWAKKQKLTTKLARINILRSSHIFLPNLFGYAVLALFFVSLVFGSFVLRDSTINTVEQGIGKNNYAIVKSDFQDFIREGFLLYSSKNDPHLLNGSSFSKQSVVQGLRNANLSTLPIDDRLITYFRVGGRTPPMHTIYDEMYVIGVSMNQTNVNWQYDFKNPKELTGNEIALGESAYWYLFPNSSRGTLLIMDHPTRIFSVKSVLKDPFLNGKTIYIPINKLIPLIGVNSDERNVIFIEIDDSTIVPKVEKVVKELGQDFVLVPLNPIIQRNRETQDVLGIILLILIFPVIFTFVLTGRNYTLHIIEQRIDLLRTIKALGASIRDITQIIENEIRGLIVWGFSLGIISGYFFITELVISNPVISNTTIFLTIFPIIITVMLIIKASRKQIVKFYHKELY
ncbi:MAG: hypothetical protein ACXAC7_17105 [Candidatus Hodarchaeales archaeon]|jgi:hypothetical protein